LTALEGPPVDMSVVAGPPAAAPVDPPAVGGRLDAGPACGPPVALYVHVPFCLSVCPYCDFVVLGGGAARGPRSRVEPFLRALHVELALRADLLDACWGRPGSPPRPPLETVYLGGGTPSLLPADAVAGILAAVRERYGLVAGAEVTIEADPAPEERGDPAALAAAGVTRMSLGAQSLDAAELRRLGRRHRPEDVAGAVRAARAGGIGSVGLDLLYDIPGQAPERWATTLEGALALEPDHLSLYALTLDDPDAEGLTGPLGDHLPVSAGARRWRDRARPEQDEDRAAAMYLWATERLVVAGYRGYEISNWARPGHESGHDLAYWTRRPYEAVGPGAHAFDGLVRRWNAARLGGYVAALDPADGSAPALPPGGSETLDATTAIVERVILGLRLDTGVPAAWAEAEPLASVAPWAVARGLAELVGGLPWVDGDRLRLTSRGRLLSNEVFARLI
jgi:coproporphyrinogen III oxidase-like Fe-S oxidoreductase